MSVPDGFIDDVVRRSAEVSSRLKTRPDLRQYMDDGLPIPRPFVGTGAIKLVVVGQDPTVGMYKTRQRITHTLMLNEGGPLTRFLQQVCGALGVKAKENVYATNLCKSFFTDPPAKVKDVNLVAETSAEWLPILLDELDHFPQACVISLGEPVLEVLLRPTAQQQMKWYWGHHPQWQVGRTNLFRLVECADSAIARRFYPFIHSNNNTGFYKMRLNEYLTFIRKDYEASQTA